MSSALHTSRFKKDIAKKLKFLFPFFKKKGESNTEIEEMFVLKLEHETQVHIRDFDYIRGSIKPLPDFASGVSIMTIQPFLNHRLDLITREYEAVLTMGEDRKGAHIGGELLRTSSFSHVTEEMVVAQLIKFEGLQTRPPDSCSKHVSFCSVHLEKFDPPHICLKVNCALGFSIFRFTIDLAKALGTSCNISQLHRHRFGPFSESDVIPSYAISMERLAEITAKFKPALAEENYNLRQQYGSLVPKKKSRVSKSPNTKSVSE